MSKKKGKRLTHLVIHKTESWRLLDEEDEFLTKVEDTKHTEEHYR